MIDFNNIEQVQAENAILKNLLTRFIAFRIEEVRSDTHDNYNRLKEDTIKRLTNIKDNKSLSRVIGIAGGRNVETKRDELVMRFINLFAKETPELCAEFIYGKKDKSRWEVFFNNHDEDIGVGSGKTLFKAMKQLSGMMPGRISFRKKRK